MLDVQSSIPTAASLLALLVDIERLSRESAISLPERDAPVDVWDGIVYSLGAEMKLVSAVSEITEMMPYPNQVTAVPGTKPWVVGLANVRGNLLPIIDMQIYFGLPAVAQDKRARLLVIRLKGLHIGLLVSDVLGIQHFAQNQRKKASMNGALAEYVENAYQSGEDYWPVFKFSGLADNPDFRIAAV